MGQVDFFVDGRGDVPVQDFLVNLPRSHKAKALAMIRMLEQEGPSLPFPYSSQVRGKLRELRTQQGKDKLRILYFGDSKRVFILLHGMVKRGANCQRKAFGLPKPGCNVTTRHSKEGKVATRWNRFYEKQMEDRRLRELVEREIESLQLGIQIARLREKEILSQTKLAALAGMSAPKISAIENEPRNLTIATLIRVAHALGSKVEIKLVPQRRRRSVRAA